jgi:hypothetical protein
MGLLSDFFIAAPEDISADRFKLGPADTFPTVQAKRITPLELAQLLAILRNDHDADTVKSLDAFPVMLTCPGEDAWVVACPEDLRDALAQSSAEDVARYASVWAQYETLRDWGFQAVETAALLQDGGFCITPQKGALRLSVVRQDRVLCELLHECRHINWLWPRGELEPAMQVHKPPGG